MKFGQIAITLFFLFQTFLCPAQNNSSNGYSNGDGIVLIITSYNPDTRRMSSFIEDFEKAVKKNDYQFSVFIENMGFKGLNESHTWSKSIQQTIEKYKSKNLRAIILLGQEAWISFINQKDFTCDVPFFSCFASRNGIILPDKKIDKEWEPEYIDAIELAKKIGKIGGCLNNYDLEYNIKTIKTIYPTIENFALLTDNSYGGVSLQALVSHEMQTKFPELNLIKLDLRKQTTQEVEEEILNLPDNTALLLGTWRINREGLYFPQSSISQIISSNTKNPVFSLTGFGIGSVAIGGYIPNYSIDVSKIAEDINSIFQNEIDTAMISFSNNMFIVDRAKIKQFGINTYQLPPNTIIRDEIEEELKKTKKQTFYFALFALLLAFFSLVLFIMSQRLRRKSKELIIAKEKAEESEKLKSAFLANMSHEIRTPLNSIVGFSDMLINTNDESKKATFGKIITTNSDLLLNLINDILDLSKIESGYTQFVFSDVDVSTLFNELYTTYSVRMRNNVELFCINPYQTCIVHIDKQRTLQIITNFITNAIKFTQNGSISIGYEYINDGLKFYVTDTGIGIDPNSTKKIFNRFEKLNTFAQGTGLGLSICKAIIDSQKGEIGVDSIAGKGSTFWAWVPCKQISTNKTDFTPNGTYKVNIFRKFNQTLSSSATILVAEDDEANFILISEILNNYNISRAINGKEAIEMVSKNSYSLVLMDIKMPIMDGLEATRKIREFNSNIPIIALTANAFESDRENAINAGCNDFLTKPINKDLLQKKIITFIS